MQKSVRLFLLVVLWFVSIGQLDRQADARQLDTDPISGNRLYLSTLSTQADLVMVGQVNYITEHYYTDATDQPLNLSEIEVTPIEMLKGDTPPTATMLLRTITATNAIGTDGGARLSLPLTVGERVLFFLRTEDDTLQVVAGGMFPLDDADYVTSLYLSLAEVRTAIQQAVPPTYLYLPLIEVQTITAAATLEAAPGAISRNIYVDGAIGSDNNSGTARAPYKTIAKANTVVRSGAGDTVYIRSGIVYNEALLTAPLDTVTYRAWNKIGDAPTRLPPVIDTPADTSAIELYGRHDITMDGFFFRDPGHHWAVIADSYRIWLRNSFFDQDPAQIPAYERFAGLEVSQSSHHVYLQGNHFNRWGSLGGGDMIFVNSVPKNGGVPSAENPGVHHLLLENNFFDGFNPANPKNSAEWGQGAYAGHALVDINGRWNVIRNNIFFNFADTNVGSSGHFDKRPFPELHGWNDGTQILFEGNLFKHALGAIGGGWGLQVSGSAYMIRFNRFVNNSWGGLGIGAWDTESFLVPAISHHHVYHNTFYHNGFGAAPFNEGGDAISVADVRPQSLQPKQSDQNYFSNNLFYDNHGGSFYGAAPDRSIQLSFLLREDNGSYSMNANHLFSNLFYRASGAGGNEILVYAGLTNNGPPDFHYPAHYYHFSANHWNTKDGELLGDSGLFEANLVANPRLNPTTLAPMAGSAALNRAWALAFATNAGTAATNLQVNNAHWFSDGYRGDGFDALVAADTMRLGEQANSAVVQIADVDYDTNMLTLAAPASWRRNTQIYLYKNSICVRVLYGMAPDIGAVQVND